VRVTAAVDYAVRAVLELAVRPPGERVQGAAIARSQAISFRFVERLLADLRRAGIVASQRGQEGGYWLARPAAEITVADVIRAVEGPLADVHGTPPEAVAYPEPAGVLRELWVATRASLRGVLEEVTFADLASGALPEELRSLLADDGAWVRRSRPG
jgi:Rrf2 family protein